MLTQKLDQRHQNIELLIRCTDRGYDFEKLGSFVSLAYNEIEELSQVKTDSMYNNSLFAAYKTGDTSMDAEEGPGRGIRQMRSRESRVLTSSITTQFQSKRLRKLRSSAAITLQGKKSSSLLSQFRSGPLQ
jgi:hypothetical protein